MDLNWSQQAMFDYGMSYCGGGFHFCFSGLDITITYQGDSSTLLGGECKSIPSKQKKTFKKKNKWIHRVFAVFYKQQKGSQCSIIFAAYMYVFV